MKKLFVFLCILFLQVTGAASVQAATKASSLHASSYLPPAHLTTPYETTPLGGLEGEPKARLLRSIDRLAGVPYMNAQQRLRYQAHFVNGLVYRGKNHLLGRTSLLCDKLDYREYIYIMDAEGRFYIATRDEVLHHSSFLSAEPVAAAGLIHIAKGKILLISNESRHYQPTRHFLDQAIEMLDTHGIRDFEILEKDWLDPNVEKRSVE